tara:strand:+ start:161 stop:322 length:162 start_codon:yes stop_codon:yes gene_type:complete
MKSSSITTRTKHIRNIIKNDQKYSDLLDLDLKSRELIMNFFEASKNPKCFSGV